MTRTLASAAIMIALLAPAQAGLVTVGIAGGQSITVSSTSAHRFVAFFAALHRRIGHLPHVSCYARGGHVSGSTHYSGNGCDVGQTGWNRTVPAMYRLGGLAAAHGLRDGCSFRDCGHVDVPGASSRRHHGRAHRYGRHYHRHHHATGHARHGRSRHR